MLKDSSFLQYKAFLLNIFNLEITITVHKDCNILVDLQYSISGRYFETQKTKFFILLTSWLEKERAKQSIDWLNSLYWKPIWNKIRYTFIEKYTSYYSVWSVLSFIFYLFVFRFSPILIHLTCSAPNLFKGRIHLLLCPQVYLYPRGTQNYIFQM